MVRERVDLSWNVEGTYNCCTYITTVCAINPGFISGYRTGNTTRSCVLVLIFCAPRCQNPHGYDNPHDYKLLCVVHALLSEVHPTIEVMKLDTEEKLKQYQTCGVFFRGRMFAHLGTNKTSGQQEKKEKEGMHAYLCVRIGLRLKSSES